MASGIAPNPELYDAVRMHVRPLRDALAPWHAGYDYCNFVDAPAEAELVLLAASHEQLQKVTAGYDPDQTMISAHAIRPAGN